MSKNRKHHRKRSRQHVPGTEPGTLESHPQAREPIINVIAYSADLIEEKEIHSIQELQSFVGKYAVVWVNVEGTDDAETIAAIGSIFNLHKLALEDVMNSYQRAKVEDYDGYLYIVARMLKQSERLETEQLNLFLGQDFVLTFHEFQDGDPFDPVRDRIRKGHGKLRASGPDFLAHALLDAIIDLYYPTLESFGEQLEDLETQLYVKLEPSVVRKLHGVKRDLLTMRRAIWPLREAINSLLRDGAETISAEARVFLRDCYDHVVGIMDLIETYRELSSSLTDLYLSSVSNRMNDVMKLLTVISTIFLPATLIAGIYGMNFNTSLSPFNMPELNWYFGYPIAIALMILLTLFTLNWFRQKGWIQSWLPSGDEVGSRASTAEPEAHLTH